MSDLDQAKIWDINRAGWDKMAHHFYGVAALPQYGPLTSTEDDLGLLGDLQGKTLLEIGCGSGHSLVYLAKHGASELWGLDLSSTQIAFAQMLLQENGVNAHLLNAPMETNPGLPTDHFDGAVSLYSLGWTADLATTLKLVYSYLKPDGFYLFTGEHPFYSCLDYENGDYAVKLRYRDEATVIEDWNGVPIVIQRRTLSTFINTALATGFQIERLVEGELNLANATPTSAEPDRWYAIQRATLVPTTFILKLRKPSA